jgi:hypothetical protein
LIYTTKLQKKSELTKLNCLIYFAEMYSYSNCVFPLLQITTGGLAQAGLPLPFLRVINVQIRTKLSAEILPRLRQTAR